MIEPDLFTDEPCSTISDWREVPQDLFLSWSEQRQLAYCMARDLDSAEHATDLEDIEFFTERARAYQEMMACLNPTS